MHSYPSLSSLRGLLLCKFVTKSAIVKSTCYPVWPVLNKEHISRGANELHQGVAIIVLSNGQFESLLVFHFTFGLRHIAKNTALRNRALIISLKCFLYRRSRAFIHYPMARNWVAAWSVGWWRARDEPLVASKEKNSATTGICCLKHLTATLPWSTSVSNRS